VASQAPFLKLPSKGPHIVAGDTVAALAIERDSIFIGSMDKTDTSQGQRYLIDQMPVPLKRITPKYPPRAFSMRLQGTVKLRLWIDKEGIPQKWKVTECTDSVFVENTTASAMNWEFSPAVVKGTPVGVWAAITFEYLIQQ
jgi:TonB family protein